MLLRNRLQNAWALTHCVLGLVILIKSGMAQKTIMCWAGPEGILEGPALTRHCLPVLLLAREMNIYDFELMISFSGQVYC